MSEVVIDDGGLSDCSIPPPPPSPPIRVLKSDRRRMDFVADSDASTDEEDHEGHFILLIHCSFDLLLY